VNLSPKTKDLLSESNQKLEEIMPIM